MLENFGSSNGNGGGSTASSTGGTLAAAAKAAQLVAWLQDILEASWFAKLTRHRNRVSSSSVQDEQDDGGSRSPVASGGRQASQGVAAAAFQVQPASAGSSADGATRGPAALHADARVVTAHSAFEHRSSVTGGPTAARGRWVTLRPACCKHSRASGGCPCVCGQATAALGSCFKRLDGCCFCRSFSPLVPPSSSSDNLQGLLGSRHGSFFGGGQSGARTHSVTGLAPKCVVSRSAQSCTSAVSPTHWKLGSNSDPWITGRAAAAAHDVPTHARPGASQHSDAPANVQVRLTGRQWRVFVGLHLQDLGSASSLLRHKELSMYVFSRTVAVLLQAAELAAALDRGLSSSSAHQVLGVTPRTPLAGRSCWLFGPDNRLRLQLHRVLCHPWFEPFILVLILLSSIALALDMPHLDPAGTFKRALEVLDCIFAVLFLVEAALKVGACSTADVAVRARLTLTRLYLSTCDCGPHAGGGVRLCPQRPWQLPAQPLECAGLCHRCDR